MGQYKVPQDVEAEDKIIGFLTLKQFIYTVIGVAWAFLSFQLFKGFLPLMIMVGLPPTALFLALGLWQRQGQPFEAYFLALVNFTVKPRRRIWMKEPIFEAFKVEAPIVTHEATQRDPREIRGQLEKLAQVVDTRGWSAKQPEIQEPQLVPTIDLANRIAVPEAPAVETEHQPIDVHLADDILDFQHNPNAQSLNVLIQDAERTIREEARAKMTEDGKKQSKTSTSGVSQAVSPDILKVAMDKGDLKVSQIASHANRQNQLPEGQSVSLRNNA
jgi:hypothetical protein